METPEMEFKDETVGEAEEDQEHEVSSELEKSKIGIMRAFVESQDPSSKDEDDFMLRRFLRARGLDVEKASKMFLKYLSWKRSYMPNGSGRPILVVNVSRHFPAKSNVEEFKRLVVYFLEKLCSRLPPGEEKFVIIGDLEGWGYENSDIRGYLGALSILQEFYPERLGKLFLVHVPYTFMTAWKIIYPFIDSNTKKKINFVVNKKLETTLLSAIDESQLSDVYGGKLPLVPIQNA